MKLVGSVERGEQNPSLRVLEKLARGLGVELHELMRVDHHVSVAVLRARIEARLKAASDDELRRVYQLLQVIFAADARASPRG